MSDRVCLSVSIVSLTAGCTIYLSPFPWAKGSQILTEWLVPIESTTTWKFLWSYSYSKCACLGVQCACRLAATCTIHILVECADLHRRLGLICIRMADVCSSLHWWTWAVISAAHVRHRLMHVWPSQLYGTARCRQPDRIAWLSGSAERQSR